MTRLSGKTALVTGGNSGLGYGAAKRMSAAKAGLRSFVRTWMNERRDRRIRVNAVSPGVIHTESYEKDMGVDGRPPTSSV